MNSTHVHHGLTQVKGRSVLSDAVRFPPLVPSRGGALSQLISIAVRYT
jgi:hypothetical protein